MKSSAKKPSKGITRRDALKLSGLALGGLAIGNAIGPGTDIAQADDARSGGTIFNDPANRNTYFAMLRPYHPGSEPLGPYEMRISFLGTSCIPRISQAAVSVFVELGNGDSFVFDAGTGVVPKYFAMGHTLDRMDKIFIAHLHADHMGDLPFIYGFGPSYGRLWPLYIWGPNRSGFTFTAPDNTTRGPFNDGTADLTDALTKMSVWHNESQSFLVTGYSDYPVPGWGVPGKTDGYDIVTHELDWTKKGDIDPATGMADNIAYNYNGVKITHFPAVHTREGAISYKLEWNGLSMIYSGDTKPSQYVIDQAKSGVDVLIHEIVMPAADWNEKMGLPPEDVTWTQAIQDSSHTPQKAFGYILNQLRVKPNIAPRLAVGTHFQAEDDTIKSALHDIRLWYPRGNVVIASDLMVINVSKNNINVRRAVVSDYAWPQHTDTTLTSPNSPKYWKVDETTGKPTSDPTAQIDPDAPVIDPDLYNAR